jgi:hypothetical protein
VCSIDDLNGFAASLLQRRHPLLSSTQKREYPSSCLHLALPSWLAALSLSLLVVLP